MRADLTCTIFSNFTVFLAPLTLVGWNYNALTHCYYRLDRNASPQPAPNLPLLLPPSLHSAHLPPSRASFSLIATALVGRVPGYSARRKIRVDNPRGFQGLSRSACSVLERIGPTLSSLLF